MRNSIEERYDRIKKWLTEFGVYVVNEREIDNEFHFSFWIWPKTSGKVIPLIIGLLKQPVKGQDCILIGWGWNVDTKSDVMRDIINDPEKTTNLVNALKKVINPQKYNLKISPDEVHLEAIRVSFIYPIDRIDMESLRREITETWLQYANLLLHIELKSGRPTSVGL